METIKTGKFVELIYEVFVVDGEEKTSMMKFTEEKPDCFVYGVEQDILESFLQGLEGLKAGDNFDLMLTPDKAFGDHKDEYVMHIDKTVFEVEGKFDDEQVRKGNVIPMMTQDGFRVQGIVLDVTDDKVSMDFNHPLAGETVQYVGTVKTVRDATPEEMDPQKHSCNCGSCGDGGCGDGCGDGCNGCH